MLPQKMALEAMTIHGSHHRSDQPSERLGEPFQLLIVGMLQDIVIEVSNEMDQALLLGAANSVVGRVEVGHQDSVKSLSKA